MPGINAGWDNATPAGSESVSLGDDRIRSLKTSVQQVLDAEHVFGASGGAGTGIHRPGSAMAAVGTQSLVSSADTEGRIFYASDTSRLFATPSNGTVFIGGPTVISAGSFPGGLPQRAIWVEDFGLADSALGNGQTITFPHSGYSGVPFVTVSAWTDNVNATPFYVTMRALSATAVTVAGRKTADGTIVSNWTIMWRSVGTMAL